MATETETPVVEESAGPKRVHVHPATLGIRDLKHGETTVAGVYGGAEGKVWVATFADPNEAQAWILASNHFKQPVNGYEMGVDNGAGEQGRNQPQTVN